MRLAGVTGRRALERPVNSRAAAPEPFGQFRDRVKAGRVCDFWRSVAAFVIATWRIELYARVAPEPKPKPCIPCVGQLGFRDTRSRL